MANVESQVVFGLGEPAVKLFLKAANERVAYITIVSELVSGFEFGCTRQSCVGRLFPTIFPLHEVERDSMAAANGSFNVGQTPLQPSFPQQQQQKPQISQAQLNQLIEVRLKFYCAVSH